MAKKKKIDAMFYKRKEKEAPPPIAQASYVYVPLDSAQPENWKQQGENCCETSGSRVRWNE